MEEKFIKRFISYCNSLDSLKEAKNRNKNDNFVLAGTIQMFNLTFDLSWKVMKDLLQKHYLINDYATGSPKENIRTAASCGLINDDLWIDMCLTRNGLAHDYDQSLAKDKFDDIMNEYIPLFEEFKTKVEDIIRH